MKEGVHRNIRQIRLTRPFDETVRERFLRDESFREALIAEAFKEIESGDKAVGLAILKDCIFPAYRGAGRGL